VTNLCVQLCMSPRRICTLHTLYSTNPHIPVLRSIYITFSMSPRRICIFLELYTYIHTYIVYIGLNRQICTLHTLYIYTLYRTKQHIPVLRSICITFSMGPRPICIFSQLYMLCIGPNNIY
jgi:hypothetical protein